MLRSTKMFDYENDGQVLLIDVRMEDQNNSSIEKTFEIRIIDQHRPIVRTGVALDISIGRQSYPKSTWAGGEPVIMSGEFCYPIFPNQSSGAGNQAFIYEGNETGTFEILIIIFP